jgi:hypothetical protein
MSRPNDVKTCGADILFIDFGALECAGSAIESENQYLITDERQLFMVITGANDGCTALRRFSYLAKDLLTGSNVYALGGFFNQPQTHAKLKPFPDQGLLLVTSAERFERPRGISRPNVELVHKFSRRSGHGPPVQPQGRSEPRQDRGKDVILDREAANAALIQAIARQEPDPSSNCRAWLQTVQGEDTSVEFKCSPFRLLGAKEGVKHTIEACSG